MMTPPTPLNNYQLDAHKTPMVTAVVKGNFDSQAGNDNSNSHPHPHVQMANIAHDNILASFKGEESELVKETELEMSNLKPAHATINISGDHFNFLRGFFEVSDFHG